MGTFKFTTWMAAIMLAACLMPQAADAQKTTAGQVAGKMQIPDHPEFILPGEGFEMIVPYKGEDLPSPTHVYLEYPLDKGEEYARSPEHIDVRVQWIDREKKEAILYLSTNEEIALGVHTIRIVFQYWETRGFPDLVTYIDDIPVSNFFKFRVGEIMIEKGIEVISNNEPTGPGYKTFNVSTLNIDNILTPKEVEVINFPSGKEVSAYMDVRDGWGYLYVNWDKSVEEARSLRIRHDGVISTEFDLVNPPEIIFSDVPEGTVGERYETTLIATNHLPLTWSVHDEGDEGELPDGLSLSSNGVISGTPTTAGTTYFAAVVSNGKSSSATMCEFVIREAVAPIRVLTVTPHDESNIGAPLGHARFDVSTQNIGVVEQAVVTVIPDNLGIYALLTVEEGGFGHLAVTWPEEHDAIHGVHVTYNGITSNSFDLFNPPTITTTSLQDGTVGTAFNQTLTAESKVPVTWSIRSSTQHEWPDGLSLSADGIISGTPTTAGDYNIAIQATNGVRCDRKEYTMAIKGKTGGSEEPEDPENPLPATYYPVNIASFANGKVNTDKATCKEGETVTLTLSDIPAGYELESISVLKTVDGVTPETLTGSGLANEAEYTFTMPACAVTVTATFTQIRNGQEGTFLMQIPNYNDKVFPVDAFELTVPFTGEILINPSLYLEYEEPGGGIGGIEVREKMVIPGSGVITLSFLTDGSAVVGPHTARVMAAGIGAMGSDVAVSNYFSFRIYPEAEKEQTIQILNTTDRTPGLNRINIRTQNLGIMDLAEAAVSNLPSGVWMKVHLFTIEDGRGHIEIHWSPQEIKEIRGIRITCKGQVSNEFDISAYPSITTPSLPDGTVGTKYEQALEATDDLPLTWSISEETYGYKGLPDGLSLSAEGIISGTPTTAGVFMFGIKVTNGTDISETTYVITIKEKLKEPEEPEDPENPLPATYYPVNIASFANGKVNTDKATCKEGETVTLTLSDIPAGYELESISVLKTVDGVTPETLTGSGLANGAEYTFTMPACAVTVEASFKKTQAQLLKESLEAAVRAVEGGSYIIRQLSGNSRTVVRNWLVNTLNTLFGKAHNALFRSDDGSIIGDVEITAFTPAIAGTAANPKGTDGSFTFTVTLSRGGTVLETGKTTGTITAIPYDTPSSAAESPKAESLKAYVQNGTLYAIGLTPGQPWSVYTITGRPVHHGTARSSNERAPLPSQGIYIVKSGKQVVKVIY